MSVESSFQHECLEPLLAHFQSTEIPAELLAPSETFPYWTLSLQVCYLGGSGQTVPFELSLPPGTSEPSGGTYLLLIMGTLKKDVRPEALGPLAWTANMLNTRMALGAFVVLEQERQLIFRQSILLDHSTTVKQEVKLVDLQFALIMHELDMFIDALMDVAAGEEPKEVLRRHPQGDMFPLEPPQAG